jgi:lipoprotein NlpD
LTVVGCSSSGYRAPVLDVTSPNGQSNSTNTLSAKSQKSAKEINFNGNFNTYKVKKGDTLYSIAWNSSSDVKSLATYNKLKPPYTIYTGQVLNLKPPTTKSISNSQKISKKSQLVSVGEKKVKKEVVLEKVKGYSPNAVEKKLIPEKKVIPKKVVTTIPAKKTVPTKTVPQAPKPVVTQSKKINSWSWPAKGKVIESFVASQAGMKGISIENQRGTSIYAASDGQVVYAGSGLRGYGNLIIIKHSNDYLSAYAHNESLLVSENEQIKKGQKIALMGDSGTDSVHLHFEIRYRGKSVDPLRYLNRK